jgi:hypothetical protein
MPLSSRHHSDNPTSENTPIRFIFKCKLKVCFLAAEVIHMGVAWTAVDGSDGQISIPVFDAYIRCLNVVHLIFGEFVMFIFYGRTCRDSSIWAVCGVYGIGWNCTRFSSVEWVSDTKRMSIFWALKMTSTCFMRWVRPFALHAAILHAWITLLVCCIRWWGDSRASSFV